MIDALLGIGAKGTLREPVRGAVTRLNEQRRVHATPVVSLDVPTGLNADTGEVPDTAVIADFTFFVGAPKRGLLASHAVNYVGRLEAISLGELPQARGDSSLQLITPKTFLASLSPRPHDFHKGNAGRVTIVAGSRGMEGAALLCATAALRIGAGLVTLWVIEDAYTSVVSRACPALMVRSYRDWCNISLENANAFAVGPGLGLISENDFAAMAEMIESSNLPGVFDADALNAIARYQGYHCLHEQHVITPHPGEFARLAPASAIRSREDASNHFTENHPSVLLLKGARTLVQQRGGPLYHNSTGHAGMATAGMGDILAGVISGLQAQGLSSITASCAASWLCGRAAEIFSTKQNGSIIAVTAPDLLDCLGAALLEWQTA
jgi:NAD(P)H-hydrate epimerase